MSTDDFCQEPLQQGDEFLQYRIGALLGRGGHAFVYAAQHRYMERPVAIKVIPAPGASNSDIHKRAQLEAQILSQLEHPNVVKVYDAGVTDSGVIYIVMEMLEGWTLRAALKSLHAFTVPETLHIGLQIASAVQVAHAQHAIHRDLKPENVFVLPGNLVKVLDFGITKLLHTNVSMTTQPHLIRGTPQYMSPEHMEGRAVTVRSDIYALGSVLYELLAAIAPALIGLQEVSSYAIGYSQIHRVPPPLDEFVPQVPGYVAGSIQRMLAKDPEQRPACMRDVADELRALQARYAAEARSLAGGLRELWHAPLLALERTTPASGTGTQVISNRAAEPRLESRSGYQATRPVNQAGVTRVTAATADDRSSATALLVPDKTRRLAAEQNAIAIRGRPVREPDPMALRLADRRSSSAPVQVTSSRPRTRTPSHTASLLLAAVVLGSVIGYGALMSFRRSDWAKQPPNVSASPAVAASLTLPHAEESLARTGLGTMTPRAATSLVPDASNDQAVGATLANAGGASMSSAAYSQDTGQPATGAADQTPAAESDSGTGRMSKDAPQKSSKQRPPASSTRPAPSNANKDQLIFGAEDLAW